MKRKIYFVLALILSLGASATFAIDNNPSEMPSVSDATVQTPSHDLALAVEATSDTDILIARVEEINEMDKSDLSKEEKRELRKELKETKETLQGRGIYIGAGTLILILILVILLA